jgi:hypothetical protein
LTRLVDDAPEGPAWPHEIKYDGYRMHARFDHGTVRLLTRTGLDWTRKYPAIAAAVASLPTRAAMPTPAASLAHQFDRRGGSDFGRARFGRRERGGLDRDGRQGYQAGKCRNHRAHFSLHKGQETTIASEPVPVGANRIGQVAIAAGRLRNPG